MLFLLVLSFLLSAPAFSQTAESYRKQAIELSRNKSWDQAIENYRKALVIEPNDADTHYNFALTLKYKGEAKAAVEEFEAAARLIMGDKEEALRLLTTYVAANPQVRAGMAKDETWWFRDLRSDPRWRSLMGLPQATS